MLGYVKKKHQGLFDSNDPIILPLLDNMHKFYRQWTLEKNNVKKRNKFKNTRNLCKFQRRKKTKKQAYWQEKSHELKDASN